MDYSDITTDAPDLEVLVLAFETSGDGIAMLAVDGSLRAVNAAGAAALGSGERQACLGREWAGIWPEADREAARRAIASARRGERSTCRAASPETAAAQGWWDNSVVPVPGPDGNPNRLLVVSRNVTEQRETERALDHSLRLRQAFVEATSEIVWHADLSTGITKRQGYTEFTGQDDDPGDMDGWLTAVHPDDQVRAKRAADEAGVAAGNTLSIEYRLRHRSGEWRWVEDRSTALVNGAGEVTDWVGIIVDIQARKSAEQALQKNNEHLRLAVDANGLGTWDLNFETGEREWSPELFDILRLPRTTRPAQDLFMAQIHPDDRARVTRELSGFGKRAGLTQVSVFRFLSEAGEVRWVEAHQRTFFDQRGEAIRRVGTLQDVSDRKQAEHAAWMAANVDVLTGLDNRAQFRTELDRAAADAASDGKSLGLLVIDIDRFKEVNDGLGHEIGDVLLRTVAGRLRLLVPSSAMVARLGGDEFGVITPAPDGADGIGILANRLLAGINEPFDHAGRDIECSASIGWSASPDQDPDLASLLKNAEVALHAAKAAGRGRSLAFAPAMRVALNRRIAVLRAAREALARDSILPFYQPKISIRTGEIVGFEALLRWTDETGLRSPGALQEALDDAELSVKLGARMLACIMSDMRKWTKAGIPFGHVALNVATHEFYGQSLSECILGTLAAHEIMPHQLEIEVTERVLLDEGLGTIGTTLQALFQAGVQIALDDFGTGYASLTHLTRFPVGWVKIDRSFVMNLGQDPNAAAIVRGVIGLAHGIGVKVVAEGIETSGQLDFLTKTGCDLGQGYLMAKPMPAASLPLFIDQWTERSTCDAFAARRPH